MHRLCPTVSYVVLYGNRPYRLTITLIQALPLATFRLLMVAERSAKALGSSGQPALHADWPSHGHFLCQFVLHRTNQMGHMSVTSPVHAPDFMARTRIAGPHSGSSEYVLLGSLIGDITRRVLSGSGISACARPARGVSRRGRQRLYQNMPRTKRQLSVF